jgi:hypothetical protein
MDMALLRLIVIAAMVGCLTLLFFQNGSPALSLFFLGMQTLALPLAVWIVGAIALGLLTSLIVTGLFQLSNFFAGWGQRTPRELGTGFTHLPFDRTADQASRSPRQGFYTSPSEKNWVDDAEEEKFVASPPPLPRETPYETPQPKSSTQDGSVYSFRYRDSQPPIPPKPEPPKTATAKSNQDTVDPDYRVLVPPQTATPSQSPSQSEADDWDDDSDEDWDFDDHPPRDRMDQNR